MPTPHQTPEGLFDRTWRPGHPYRPRLSHRRRVTMTLLFVLLCTVIGAYRYFTNADRVRRQAEEYLSRLTGGSVRVGGATLSIFEGLRLDDVQVFVGPKQTDDTRIFSASTFLIQYSPAALLGGKIEATRIVAIDPRVRLTENPDTHTWNVSELHPKQPTTQPQNQGPRVLPEISLRNAMVDYLVWGKKDPIGSVSIDGQLSPGPGDDHLSFKFQSKGETQMIGPRAEGVVNVATGEAQVTLWDVEFGRDMRVMLPQQVQKWWQEHHLEGSVKKTELWMNPSKPDRPFKASIALDNVALTVKQEELLGRQEIQRRAWARQAFDVMRSVGMNQKGFVDQIAESFTEKPITLRNVDGLFTFTQDGIDINDLNATFEENRFNIHGRYEGYNSDASAAIQLTNAEGRNVLIPRNPMFINSLPAEVREAYTRFRPQGTCKLQVKFVRPEQGAPPQVTGEVDVVDGNFTFEKFAYPITKAKGRIAVERDEKTGEGHLRIVKLRGHGIPGGPNENAYVEINGHMGPFSPAIEVNITVKGENVTSEPAIMAAFPPITRQALRFFDAPGKGEFPKFSGNFLCKIHRLPSTVSHWDVTTDIDLKSASGSLVAFPYPMDNVTGKMTVYEDHIQIEEARYKKGDADLLVKGSVNWGTDEERKARGPNAKPVLKPKLSIVAHNVTIDEALLNALPPMQSKWLRKVGAAGRFDLDGALSNKGSDLDFLFDVGLRNCSLWPQGNSYAVTGVNGALKLTPQKLVLTDVHGKRGESDLTTHGEINWPTHPPQVQIVAEAKNLTLDDALYQMLPEQAQKGWKSVAPQGTVDAKINFTGVPSTEPLASIDEAVPATQPSRTYELVVTPRNLTVTPQAIPYRLDNLSGGVTITPGAITMQNVTGHHGGADVHISGTASTDAAGAWDIKLAGEKMLVDDDLKKAVPDVLRSIAETSELQGTIAFNISKLKIWSDAPAPTTSPNNTKPGPSGAGKLAPESNLNVDFAAKLDLSDGSLTTGVPLAHVNGSADFTGSTRHGKLTDLAGSFDVPSLEISGRPAQNFRADLSKRPGQQVLRLANIQTQMVGGQVAGQIEWETPDSGPARYAMALVLHNADVATLTGDAMPNVHAALSASLSMQGNLDDEGSRRGGGDVAVTGQELYKIPVVMGLLQITTLSLPITSPFNEGTCKYSVDGTRVTLETIELRAKEMTMSGNGHLDYNTGRVALSFSTQSKSWLKLPVVNDLLQGARNELLQIHVRGTIQEPKVSTTSMGTFTTTVDEVIKGGNPPPDLPPVKKPKKPK